MSDEEVLIIAQAIVKPYGLQAQFEPGAKSVGVGGDCRTYTSILCLTGPWPGHEILAQVSTEISNRTPINRVLFETARK